MDFLRQTEIIEPFDTPITIIGVGSLGSFICLTLAKMGATNILIFDDDKIETHNIPNQFYRLSDIDRYKSNSLSEIVYAFTGITVDYEIEKYDNRNLEGIVISAVDNMDTRKTIWDKINRFSKVPLYIDTRMGGEVSYLYSIWNRETKRLYEKTLFPEEEKIALPCGQQSIIYCILSTAAMCAKKVKDFISKDPLVFETIIDSKQGIILNNNRPMIAKSKQVEARKRSRKKLKPSELPKLVSN